MLLKLNKRVKFPDNIVEILNLNKERYVVMQVVPEKQSPLAIENNISSKSSKSETKQVT